MARHSLCPLILGRREGRINSGRNLRLDVGGSLFQPVQMRRRSGHVSHEERNGAQDSDSFS